MTKEDKNITEHEGSKNEVCFNFVIDFHENTDPEAWFRVLDTFIDAVEQENGCAGGGMHSTGSAVAWCDSCKEDDSDD